MPPAFQVVASITTLPLRTIFGVPDGSVRHLHPLPLGESEGAAEEVDRRRRIVVCEHGKDTLPRIGNVVWHN